MMERDELFDIEMRLFLQGIRDVYGHDFTGYGEASLRRRLVRWLSRSGYPTLSAALGEVIRDRPTFMSFLDQVTVTVSEMFRDPPVYRAIRDEVVPILATFPGIRIWVAGSSRGEEAYSIALLLEEEGLLSRTTIYATDINPAAIEAGKQGIYPLSEMKVYSKNYLAAGGKGSLSDHLHARYDRVIMDQRLRERIVFASHNLATDGSFGEMQMILCRNVMIYFTPPLKERVLRLLDSSLEPGGILCIGTKETLDGRSIAPRYEEMVKPLRIYRKQYG